MKKRFLIVLILLLIPVVFFGKALIQKKVLLPGDLLVGSYYPWLEYKWGYQVGVPVKNPSISDPFSQMFIWKKNIADSYKNFQFPFWNIYSYSGYPLLANIQSAAFYPLNILFLLFGYNFAWNLYLILGCTFSLFSMYSLLRNYKLGNLACLAGALAYAFGGFSIVWMEFATVGQAMIFLPLSFLLVEKYFKASRMGRYKHLLLLPFVLCLSVFSGHYQTVLYTYFALIVLIIIRHFQIGSKKYSYKIVYLFMALFAGLLLSAPVLFPQSELLMNSVRFKEVYTSAKNYGLVPIKQLIMFFAPDFFGNPATGNYWGFNEYVETVLYQGAWVLLVLGYSLTRFKKISKNSFPFFIILIISLVLFFNNPVSSFLYRTKAPFVFSGYAGRIAIIISFSLSYFLARFLEEIKSLDRKKTITLLVVSIILYFGLLIFGKIILLTASRDHLTIAFRNLVFPTIVFMAYGGILLLSRFKREFLYLFLIVLVVDLYRFCWKYTPAVSENLVFPTTPIIEFLQKDNDIFRVERERGPVLPANTWAYYGFMSASGYDPMAPSEYTSKYHEIFSGIKSFSRYAEVGGNYGSVDMGEYNIKYLLVNKNSGLYYTLNNEKSGWFESFSTKDTAVLENKNLKPRVEVLGTPDDSSTAKILKYKPNLVQIEYTSNSDNNYLLFRDAWYPGWKAKIGEIYVNIEKTDQVFRKVVIPQGRGVVTFEYHPNSFWLGVLVSGAVVLVEALLFLTVSLKCKSAKIV